MSGLSVQFVRLLTVLGAAILLLVAGMALSACGDDGAEESAPAVREATQAVAMASQGEGLIAFEAGRDGNDEIYVMNADGSQPQRLTNNPANDQNPAWSPDGRRIVFHSNRDGNPELY